MSRTRSASLRRQPVQLVSAQAAAITAAALATAVLCIADAAVRAQAGPHAIGQKIWLRHPLVLEDSALAGVGAAAAVGEEPSPETRQQLEELAERAPLRPQPFLVAAALAERAGERQRAEQLLIEARTRDPRSRAARYLLADLYLRTGEIVAGLRELTVLGRLLNRSGEQLIPALAAYARTPGAVPKLKLVLRDNPALAPALLSALAEDPDNAGLVLELAAGSAAQAAGAQWLPKLLQSLVSSGRYEEAYRIWSRLSGANPQPGLYNPAFRATDAPAPFNWTLAKSGAGVAEPLPRGGVHLLYYGRQDVVLAQQLIILPAGRYRLAVPVRGAVPEGQQLSWSIRCLPADKRIAQIPLAAGKAGVRSTEFAVPSSGCKAQSIELAGNRQELPKSIEVEIGPLRLEKIGGQ